MPAWPHRGHHVDRRDRGDDVLERAGRDARALHHVPFLLGFRQQRAFGILPWVPSLQQAAFQVIHGRLGGFAPVTVVLMLGRAEHDDQVNVMNRPDLRAPGQAA